jgi:phage RecT family recombinase
MKTPALRDCEQISFLNAMLSLSQLGLELDGRRAHLIPFKNNQRGVTECQLIIDYKGLVDLAMRSGNVANIHADVVCQNDVFEYDCGEIKAHKIDFRTERGSVYAAYAICKFKDGTIKAEVMSLDEIKAIQERSKAVISSKKYGNKTPWDTDWNEMAKKTVFRRLSKWLPLSPEYRDILEHDADTFEPIAANAQSKATIPPPPLKKAEPVIEAKAEPVQEPVDAAKYAYDTRMANADAPKPEPEKPRQPEPPQAPAQPQAEHNESTVDGLRDAIRDLAATHFANENAMALWLKTLTSNEEKGFRGIDSLDASKSFNQLKFIMGSLRRTIAQKKGVS